MTDSIMLQFIHVTSLKPTQSYLTCLWFLFLFLSETKFLHKRLCKKITQYIT